MPREAAAVQQNDEADEAPELMVPKDAPVVMNMRFAAYRRCWADIGESNGRET